MGSFFKNFKRDIQSKWKTIFSNKYGQFGLKWIDVKKTRLIDGDNIAELEFLNHNLYFKKGQEVMHGIDEIFVDEVYKINLNSSARILDCGAHIGLSVIYFKNRFPNSRVVAFEPDANNFDLLKRNVDSFKLSNVSLHNEAVWKENTVLNFANEGNMSSRLTSEVDGTATKAIRLSDMITEKVDLLKLDIEGAEYEVIKDLSKSLNLVENIFIEYHGSFDENLKLNEILQIVTDNKFKYYIREAMSVYQTPFLRGEKNSPYDVQLNIFCFR